VWEGRFGRAIANYVEDDTQMWCLLGCIGLGILLLDLNHTPSKARDICGYRALVPASHPSSFAAAETLDSPLQFERNAGYVPLSLPVIISRHVG